MLDIYRRIARQHNSGRECAHCAARKYHLDALRLPSIHVTSFITYYGKSYDIK